MKRKPLVVMLGFAVALAACSSGGSVFDGLGTSVPQGGNVDLDVEIDEPIRPRPPTSDEPVATEADTVMIAAAIDLGLFWHREFPAVYGTPMDPLAGGLWSYGPDTPSRDLPVCGEPMAYDDIAENAFYCRVDDLIAWDREGLVEPFIDRYGAFTAALVMAHEYGHAIQMRTGDATRLQQVFLELQADCFAGAWVGWVVDGESDTFEATLAELDTAVAGLIAIRDAPGSAPDDPSAHGSGFDRVSAFADGLFAGAARCAGYGESPPVVTQQIFSADELESGGNLTPEELLPLLFDDLEDFYSQLFNANGLTWTPVNDILLYDPAQHTVSCGDETYEPDEVEWAAFYCIPDNVALIDAANLIPWLSRIGDFAVGVQVARQWAFAAQVQLGNLDDDVGTSLHADCLTGLYAGDVFFHNRPETGLLVLSAGDLDEAIISFIEFGTPGEDGSTGTIFERTDAFRTGFLGIADSCELYLNEG